MRPLKLTAASLLLVGLVLLLLCIFFGARLFWREIVSGLYGLL